MAGYDEFGLLQENASEFDLPWSGPPDVARQSVALSSGQRISALVWGKTAPELVLIHGGAQNAHTWDTVALALGRPLVAIDLPGHGHSDWREDHDYSPELNADAMAVAIEALAPEAKLVVGMSLGGLTTCALASRYPQRVRKAALVDVTPGVTRGKSTAIVNFIRGPGHFGSFSEILKRTMEHNPMRSEASLRRGIMHNAKELPDGRWTWRYDRSFGVHKPGAPVQIDFSGLWEHVSNIRAPLMLARGSLSPVVDDADVAELLRRQPNARVEVVDGAGHSIQGDRPLELAQLLGDFI